MKKRHILHPFLFAVYPLLFLFVHNIAQLSFVYGELIAPVALVLALTVVLLVAFTALLGSYPKGALATSLLLILFFSYGRVYDLVGARWFPTPLGMELDDHRVLLPIWVATFAVWLFYLYRSRGENRVATTFFNVLGGVLVFFSVSGIVSYEVQTAFADPPAAAADVENVTLQPREPLRDIYLIILDGYAAGRTLDELFAFDNSEFLGWLADRGFTVADRSHSNYAATFLSLASMLNLEYVNYLADIEGETSRNRRLAYRIITDNRAARLLEPLGYRFVLFSSGWGPTERNQNAESHCVITSSYRRMLLEQTLFYQAALESSRRTRADKVLCGFRGLAALAERDEPTFAFAHFGHPHPPYLFDAAGEFRTELDQDIDGHIAEQADLYIEQLIAMNEMTQSTVDEILARSEVDPVILILSDHGSDASFYADGPSRGWRDPTPGMLRERFRNFVAFRLPNGGNALVYDSISNVNTFRLVFNHLFDADYEMLPDRSYHSHYGEPYHFTDVTDIVRYRQDASVVEGTRISEPLRAALDRAPSRP